MKNLENQLEERLLYWIDKSSDSKKELNDAAKYILFSGGKRLRPLLCLNTTMDLNGSIDLALDPACALELIHTYSLIHDDLPCMDDDDFRRGKPTLHKVYSEATAILTGDYLLTLAFEVLSLAKELSAKVKIQLIQVLTKSIGGLGLIEGQLMDIASKKISIEGHEMEIIHAKKTGYLFVTSFQFASILSNATTAIEQILYSIGTDFGLAYQLLDDIKDSDATSENANSLKVLGKKATEDKIRQLFLRIKNHLSSLSCSKKIEQFLNQIVSENSGLFI